MDLHEPVDIDFYKYIPFGNLARMQGGLWYIQPFFCSLLWWEKLFSTLGLFKWLDLANDMLTERTQWKPWMRLQRSDLFLLPLLLLPHDSHTWLYVPAPEREWRTHKEEPGFSHFPRWDLSLWQPRAFQSLNLSEKSRAQPNSKLITSKLL